MRKKVYTSPVTEPQKVCCSHVLMLSGNTGGGTIGGGGNASEGGNPPLDTRRQSVWETGNSTGWEEDW